MAAKDVREAASGDWNWSYAGKRKFKGISEDQVLFRVRKGDQPEPPKSTT